MAGAAIEFDQKDLKKVLEVLNKLDQVGANLLPVWDDIGGYFGSITAERFQTGTAPDGKAWEPSRRATNELGKTLVDQGHLRDSFTWNVDANGKGMEFGTNLVYGGIHQFGGQTGRNKSVTLPARPILPERLNADDQNEILNILELHLIKVLN